MKGHLYKRGKTWTYVVDIGYDEVTGKRKQKNKGGFKRQKDAQAALNKVLTEIEEGSYLEPSKEKLSAFIDLWLEGKKMNLKESSYELYRRYAQTYITPKIGAVTLEKLKPSHIQKLYNEMAQTHSPATVNKVHKILKGVLDQAVNFKYLRDNPALRVEKPKEEKRSVTVWDEKQVQHFLDIVKKSRYYIVFLLAVTTGMRRSEILGLRWQDIDFDQGTISIRQTLSAQNKLLATAKTASSQRSIDLDANTLIALKEHRVRVLKEKMRQGSAYYDLDLVCCTTTGKILHNESLWSLWSAYVKESKLPRIRFHDLRHTHATLMLRAGVHPKVVAERLGHTNVSITLNTYSHVVKGMQKEAAQKVSDLLFRNIP
ncbi:site-specific integrase [Ectobacillus sp. JY-23]|uniref:site-specific integrase n=1 Tax=Ectobacillus sp. JY-23 TaxID=2933872 RepID=UPI001FF354AE|nr:site-specific integrase [Ectobacillus sp. JY-23]UOY92868.1 site-specific integrase [Ectobacillus sp. JY-23]